MKSSNWLERRFLKITFSEHEDEPEVDIREIQQLLKDEVKESRSCAQNRIHQTGLEND